MMKDDFSRVFPNRFKFCFKTNDESNFLFPGELERVEGTPDLVNDLMTIHVGRIYEKAMKMKNNDGDLLFGNLPTYPLLSGSMYKGAVYVFMMNMI